MLCSSCFLEVFEHAVLCSDGAKAVLWTGYGNFLLATGQVAQAHDCLIQAIDSGDTQSELGYDLIDKATVSPLLQERIDRDAKVQVRAIDYAYYLLIFHYKEFAQAGISLRTISSRVSSVLWGKDQGQCRPARQREAE